MFSAVTKAQVDMLPGLQNTRDSFEMSNFTGAYNIGLNDLYTLDLVNYTWTDLTQVVQGTPPLPRGGHGFTSCNGRLFVFGGTKGNDFGARAAVL